MTELDHPPVEPTTDTDVRGSVFAKLREQHREIQQDIDPLYLDAPFYDGLVIKYRYVSLQETKGSTEALRKITNVTDQALAAALDTLLLACDEMFAVHPSGEKPRGRHDELLYGVPLIALADPGSPPIRFDEQLAAAMELPPNLAGRQIIRKLFGDKDWPIIEHAQEVSNWLATAGARVREKFQEG